MKKLLFIILNSISIIVEYILIYLFFNIILHKSFLISIIMTMVIFFLMLILTLFASHQLKLQDDNEENKPLENELLNIINVAEIKYNKKFVLHYISAPQPNPAWCIGNNLYINNSCSVNPIYLPGIVAHELGHAISGLSNYTIMASLKPSTMISKIIYLTIVALFRKKKLIFKIIIFLLLFIYILFSLNNMIFTYPFLIQDEFTANTIAVKLGYGDSLRCYYGLAKFDNDNDFLRKIDFMHPTVIDMLDRVNKELNIKDEYLDMYYCNGILLTCYNDTPTITLPNFIREIGNMAFVNKNLKKVTGMCVLKVNHNSFFNNAKLEEINLPNVIEFNTLSIRKLDNLKEIKINNLNIQKQIYLKYQNANKLFAKKFFKNLKNNNLIDDEIIQN